MLSQKRASNDFRLLQKTITEKKNPSIISAVLKDLYHWSVVVTPPTNSLYAGRQYTLDVILTTDFPSKPPAIKFVTPIFNPGVMKDGSLCERLIDNEDYKPTQQVQLAIEKVMNAIFVEYDKIEAVNTDAGQLLTKSLPEFKKKVEEVKKKA
ncbi:ubiquitin-conjugating enzyme E2 D/E [Strigomonas culicis]|uniref:Ubiquitin-conjugating enzyme E2 D/E n=1 Tax=Strigomonas culicis TaxID=28005 RepID=S9UAB1_9TRYP|nr:ubiquitin-conjugating enzyme E2 D/E [Strigomonas culicis]EPY25893.1 ubiquitin-conjugating enzyme E2 D/E [Strigomonas culicis]|eukprot:EPY25528.1 ubiquitin-conjugating enzyme E2 D/E [Strigomonas culicis]